MNRNFLIALAIVVVGGAAYLWYSNSNQPQTQTAQAPVDQTQAPVTQTPTPLTPSPEPIVAPTPSKTVSVAISNMAFGPRQVSVTAGTKVTWKNDDGVAHTVTSNGGTFDSRTLNPDGTYSFVFNTPGTYNYHCSIHPSMTATVIVTQ